MPARNCTSSKDHRAALHRMGSVSNADTVKQMQAVLRDREVGRTLRSIARWRYGARMVVGLGFALAVAVDRQLLEHAARWLKVLIP